MLRAQANSNQPTLKTNSESPNRILGASEQAQGLEWAESLVREADEHIAMLKAVRDRLGRLPAMTVQELLIDADDVRLRIKEFLLSN
jgi:hypothetical protein